MSRWTADVGGVPRLLSSPDDEVQVLGARVQNIARGLVVDEVTGEPPTSTVRITTARPGLVGSVGGGGIVGLVGAPVRVFPEDPARWPVAVPLEVTSDGFIPLHREPNLAVTPGFPEDYAPFDLGRIELHRVPVVIEGRVTTLVAGEPVPVPGADLTIERVWPQHPDPVTGGPGDLPRVLSLNPPLRRQSTVVAGRCRSATVAWAVQLQQLTVGASVGDTELRLSNHVGLAPGDTVAVRAFDAEREEIVEITDIEGAAVPDRPALVRLRQPLAFRHPIRTDVRAVTIAFGAVNAQSREAIRGDTPAFLNAMVGLPIDDQPFQYVAMDTATTPPDIHAARAYATRTDADGFYRLPPLSRVAQVTVRADAGVGGPIDTVFTPDYDEYRHVLDFRL